MKIKVRREDLIARVREVQAERDVQYATELAAYNEAHPAYRAGVVDELRRLADQIETKPKTGVPGGYDICRKFPSQPSKPVKPSKDERLLRQLNLAQDEYLTISVNDYSEYL